MLAVKAEVQIQSQQYMLLIECSKYAWALTLSVGYPSAFHPSSFHPSAFQTGDMVGSGEMGSNSVGLTVGYDS